MKTVFTRKKLSILARNRRKYVIQSVEKALKLLKVFTDSKPDFSLMEISNLIGLNPSSTYRLLVTLEESDYVEQNPQTGRYHLGLASLRLASGFQEQNDLRKVALPIMQRLRDTYKETVHLARLVGSEVIYLEKLVALLPIGIIGVPPGGRAPAYCTALGKVMLAYQPEEEVRRRYQAIGLETFTPYTIHTVEQLLSELATIRCQGYAFDNQETNLGVRCVAVPIHNGSHTTIAAMSISGPMERIDVLVNQRGVIEALLSASRQISERLAMGGSA